MPCRYLSRALTSSVCSLLCHIVRPPIPPTISVVLSLSSWDRASLTHNPNLCHLLHTREEIERMSVKELREFLRRYNISTTGLLEKSEFVQKAKEQLVAHR